MHKAGKALALVGASAALVGSAVAPSMAAAQRSDPYTNTHLVKVWGTRPGHDVCISVGSREKAAAVIAGCNMHSKYQMWTLKHQYAGGVTTIKNTKTGKCLGVTAKRSGTVVRQYKCNGSKQQKWALGGSKVHSVYAGYSMVISANTSRSGQQLTITKSGESNSARIKQEWGLKK
ncbi:RICIN domain-containing protein [Streptomyces sp. NPDC101225]|uniref:RICIN domain-containing protein n=1 Tax=Streptomyces sp. NPDC101225 TaxID=3366135 RepID=UPI00382B810B